MAQPPRAPPRAVTPASAATIVTGVSAPIPTPGSQPSIPRPPAPRQVAPRSGSPSSVSAGRGAAAKLCPTCGERFPVDYRVCPRDVVPLERLSEDEADPLIGVMLADAYRVLRMIGQGGMGRVYEARHARLGARRFAVKVMHEELARKPELVTRFRREAETACVAAHPNVVQVFDVAETEAGLPFIVAELLEGEDLGQRLSTTAKLPLATTVPIVRQLCAGLSAAHLQGVVHRDLKPDNVFLVGGDSPTVKLLDFGIARVNDTGAGNRTRTGVIMGTPAYMAPEQAKGAKVDARADIYSVGAILYRCLTGHEPFEAEDPAATLTAVLTKEPKRPRSIAPEIPEAVELVIERAMARDVEQRFQTLAEFDAALGALHDDGEVSAVVSVPITGSQSGAPAPTDGTRAAQLARPLVAVLSVVAVLMIASGVAGLLGRLLARDEDGLGGSEGMLVVLGTAAVLATPAGMWFRWVRRSVWGNSLRAVGLARRMGTTMAAGAIAYLLVELVATSVELAVAEAPTLQTGLGVSLVAVALAIAVGWGADRWIARG
ncbi:MAG: protein kinase [Myxococcales bacterium]|nr:protein kinase [Myxococcales bacterium]